MQKQRSVPRPLTSLVLLGVVLGGIYAYPTGSPDLGKERPGIGVPDPTEVSAVASPAGESEIRSSLKSTSTPSVRLSSSELEAHDLSPGEMKHARNVLTQLGAMYDARVANHAAHESDSIPVHKQFLQSQFIQEKYRAAQLMLESGDYDLIVPGQRSRSRKRKQGGKRNHVSMTLSSMSTVNGVHVDMVFNIDMNLHGKLRDLRAEIRKVSYAVDYDYVAQFNSLGYGDRLKRFRDHESASGLEGSRDIAISRAELRKRVIPRRYVVDNKMVMVVRKRFR